MLNFFLKALPYLKKNAGPCLIATPLNATLIEQTELFNQRRDRALSLDKELIKSLKTSPQGEKLKDGHYDFVIGHPEDLTDTVFLAFLLENKLSGLVSYTEIYTDIAGQASLFTGR